MTRLLFTAASTGGHEDIFSEVETTSIEVIRVDSAITGLKRLQSMEFDCVVSTTGLPDVDAIQFLRRVRDEQPELPTILLVGSEDIHLLNRAHSVGIHDILTYEQDLADEVVNHIRAAAIDRQLATDRERDVRLTQLMYELIQSVQTVADAGAVKQTACRILANSDLYTLAWVSRYDPDSDRLIPEITAGIDTAHLGPRSGDDLDPDNGIKVTEFSDGHAHTEVAIPLEHDNTLYGVLYLTTTRHIDEIEREVLSELGGTIGALLEREQVAKGIPPKVEEFSAIIAHDLQNQLTTIDDHITQAREEGGHHFDQIETAFERIEEIADEAATIARGRVDPDELQPADLGEIAGSVWDHLEPETDDTTLTIVDSKTVFLQPTLLRHVFENLFQNSITHGGDFFRYGGEAQLKTVIRVGTLENGFYVEDTGRGIPQEDRQRVFQWGYTTNDDGDGIGLPLVKRFVEAHGWDITLTENEEGGARFEITFDSGFDL